MASQQFVVFDINGENFGVEILKVKEITTPMEIFKVPNAPDFIEGLINLRGRVHTVFNLRKRFYMPSRDFDDNTKIIIVHNQTGAVGIIVDEVHEITTVYDEDMESTPDTLAGLDQKYIKSIVKKDNRIIMILNLDQLVSLA